MEWICVLYSFNSELVFRQWSLQNLKLFAKIMGDGCCVREKWDACDGPFSATLKEGGFMFLDAEDDALKAFFPDPLAQLEPVTARRIFIHDNERFKKGSKEGVRRTKSYFVTLKYNVVHHSFLAKLHSSFVNLMKNKRRSFWKLHSWLRILNYVLPTDNMFTQVYIPRIVILLYIKLSR